MNYDVADSAAQAFEALRQEVSQVATLVTESRSIDYSPTLRGIADRLEALERRPVGEQPQARRDLALAISGLKAQTATLAGLVARSRAAEDQRLWLIGASAASGLIGAMLCVFLAGPVVRALPEGWGVADRMAQEAVGSVRWERGIKFMVHADDRTWNQLSTGLSLVQANTAALDKCARVAKAGKAKTCVVKMPTPESD